MELNCPSPSSTGRSWNPPPQPRKHCSPGHQNRRKLIPRRASRFAAWLLTVTVINLDVVSLSDPLENVQAEKVIFTFLLKRARSLNRFTPPWALIFQRIDLRWWADESAGPVEVESNVQWRENYHERKQLCLQWHHKPLLIDIILLACCLFVFFCAHFPAKTQWWAQDASRRHSKPNRVNRRVYWIALLGIYSAPFKTVSVSTGGGYWEWEWTSSVSIAAFTGKWFFDSRNKRSCVMNCFWNKCPRKPPPTQSNATVSKVWRRV